MPTPTSLRAVWTLRGVHKGQPKDNERTFWCSKLGKTRIIADGKRGMVRNTGFCGQNCRRPLYPNFQLSVFCNITDPAFFYVNCFISSVLPRIVPMAPLLPPHSSGSARLSHAPARRLQSLPLSLQTAVRYSPQYGCWNPTVL